MTVGVPGSPATKRASFELKDAPWPSLFLVEVRGHVGTREKSAMEKLLKRCADSGQRFVCLDFRELKSLGGGVARLLGEADAERRESGQAPFAFWGASETVQSFLQKGFSHEAPFHVEELMDLQGPFDLGEPSPVDDLDLDLVAPEQSSSEPVKPAAAPKASASPKASKSAKAPAASPKSSDAGKTAAAPTGSPRPKASAKKPAPESAAPLQPLDLGRAERLLEDCPDLASAVKVIESLLRGAGMAGAFRLLTRSEDRLRAVDDPSIQIEADGPLARELSTRPRPAAIEDVAEMILSAEEEDLLLSMDCRLLAPVRDGRSLLGVLLLRKEEVGASYTGGESLAIELLCRELARRVMPEDDVRDNNRARQELLLKQRLRQHQVLVRLSEDLHASSDEEELLGTLLLALVGEMGVKGATYLRDEGDQLSVASERGSLQRVQEFFPRPTGEALESWKTPIRLSDPPPAELAELLEVLAVQGYTMAVPLRGKRSLLGVVALGPHRSSSAPEVAPDFLNPLLQQAALAVGHAAALGQLEDQTLHVARTLMAQVERRWGGSNAPVDHVTHWVGRLADALEVSLSERQDMLRAAILRDMGMIEISDLVLRSPGSLGPEEWALVHRHPATSAELMEKMGFDEPCRAIVRAHHERFNGEGYPDGLRGADIPLGARIISVVESFVAMVHEVPYRAALNEDEALAVLRENWQMRYDPAIIATFVKLVEASDGLPDGLQLEEMLPAG